MSPNSPVGSVGAAAVVGLTVGPVLRARAPHAFARIGQGDEAFRLDQAAGRRQSR
ncbi:hypothetical protein [Streptomyces reniochalinae]|uniref:hypothetical protein n=1 Tax=Streptomyces reniochalinae TaxID=2250578 RepID=UPI0015F0D8BF|nr:hypothetical protein [Streptomyces reniochalinae]